MKYTIITIKTHVLLIIENTIIWILYPFIFLSDRTTYWFNRISYMRLKKKVELVQHNERI